ncbi:hypothetical protein A9K72_34485 [Mesorhizobium loti]|uniref:Probable transposase n=1 Tax=Rhizobium loti TaxID=381 RepID=M5B2K9_RHILI|nr:hypothetical protein A9174_32055 [Mesorhizobium loti NZP2037]OBP78125.1 hypothetical protein BAE41_30755 [Mesorhizobium loti]OBP92841.1 hypothetical protein BAE38_30700 [Mesorhizobium loti]OBQ66514.1 hypothetical protein A9K72_34485 [Mesorhizobium loti]BAN09746.1 probable transposase [Mesorhizobium loti NZP2037]
MERDDKVGVQLDVSSAGYAGRLDMIEGPTGRRRRTDAEKARIVAESLMPGVQLAEVARTAAPGFAALLVEEPPPQPRHAHMRLGAAAHLPNSSCKASKGSSCNATAMMVMSG